MEALKRVIGLAPSEKSLETLEGDIRREHSRVSKGFFVGYYRKSSKTPRELSKTTKAKRLESEFGMSLGEMESKLEKLRKFEEAQKGEGK